MLSLYKISYSTADIFGKITEKSLQSTVQVFTFNINKSKHLNDNQNTVAINLF